MKRRWVQLTTLLLAHTALAETSALRFETDIRPILKVSCFHCHGEDGERDGELDVRLVRLLQQGGESGPAVVPGDLDASLLWRRIESDEMPKGDKKLDPADKQMIRRWILSGAQTARPEPQNPEEARFTAEELDHWAFQPVVSPPVPQPPGIPIATPIDGFVAERLAANGLEFSPAADRATLIRRVTFDLTGLPPTPEEVAAFVDDSAPDAYSRLIDRLLTSPQFGVRWGRHWLDVAGYAESDGGVGTDPKRPYAWRYRDYVVDAFNQNKPIDQFIQEQLAGDEWIDNELDPGNARQIELLTATGFMRMAPDPTQSSNRLADRNQAAANSIQAISSSLLGLSVGCAQCHDHKYDPIGIDDYYAFRAVFDPVFPLEKWQTPNARLVDFTPPQVQAEVDRIEAEAKQLETDLNRRRNEVGAKIQELKLADVPAEVRDATRKAVLTKASERTAREKELLDLYPMVKPIANIVGLLIEYDMPAYRKFEKEQQSIAALRATKPALRKVMATRERPDVVPVSRVFFRGNPEAPKEIVQPRELTALRRNGTSVDLASDDQTRPTTGRRLRYAANLTNGRHPLTARVFVNRIWMHHFGQGLVATPNDFGLSGEAPSHPKLLDWLAADFVRHGWDQKRLHRMILHSRTYQQRSLRTTRQNAMDPENRLLSRANLRRLEAEAIRDAILAVSDRLNDRLSGASVPVTQSNEGKAVIGIQKIRDGIPVGADDTHPDAFRRSLYVELQRSLPLDMLSTFDLPAMNPNCDLRRPTTVATQSLYFLNDSALVTRSRELAQTLANAAPELRQRIDNLFMRLFSRPTTEEEWEDCDRFLRAQSDLAQQDTELSDAEASEIALATLCQTLLASNRFLYLD